MLRRAVRLKIGLWGRSAARRSIWLLRCWRRDPVTALWICGRSESSLTSCWAARCPSTRAADRDSSGPFSGAATVSMEMWVSQCFSSHNVFLCVLRNSSVQMKMCWIYPQSIQDVDEFVSIIRFGKIQHVITCSGHWMGAVRMRVQTAD